MSFGGFGSSTFGSGASPFGSSTPAFGASPGASPFGAQPGAASSPFGATNTAGAFGQNATGFSAAQPSAFGGGFGAAPAATPAFGAQQQTPFGAKPAGSFGGFGGAATPSFGAQQSTPAFGAAASTPAFGSAAPSAFGGGLSAPSFGNTSSVPAFGAPSPAPAFGGGSGAFGASPTGGMFGGGAAAAQVSGTRTVAYQKTVDQDNSSSAGGTQRVTYNSISNMPQYQGKSVEELRFEDYSAGCKGNTGAAASPTGAFGAAAAPGAFGQASSPFGAAPQASSPFGGATGTFGVASTPAFGAASQPAFGAGASQPAFGSFGASGTPAFGAAAPTASSPFGVASSSSTPAFGGSAFGGGSFGAASTPAFGASQAPAFGGGSSPFGAQSTPAFGVGSSSAPAFGAPAPGGTGLFGASAPASSAFGSSTPAFGGAFGASTPASTPGFGGGTSLFGTPSASTSLFNTGSTPAFGQGLAASTPFGTPQATQQPSIFGASTPSAFGVSSQPGALSAFGQSSPGLFGTASTGVKPATPSLFSNAGTSLFSGGAQPGTGTFGAQYQAGQAAVPPGIAQSPYGALPASPSIGGGIAQPVMKVGISQRPLATAGGTPSSNMITPRTITPRSGVRMRPRRVSTAMQRAQDNPALSSPALKLCSSSLSASPGGSLFTPRDNPRRLFIRDLPPSTVAASEHQQAVSPANGTNALGGVDFTPNQTRHLTITESGSKAAADTPVDKSVMTTATGLTSHGPQAISNGTGCNGTSSEAIPALPTLRQADYYMKPSLESLSIMAREDPDSLCSVVDFTVGRHGFGSVQWMGRTDVRGLDIDAIVHISHRELEVYTDDAEKPDVGNGLNKPARVTLLKVFKIDKATGKPTTDEKAIRKFRKKLIEHTAAQDSKFVSYDDNTGEWVFEVEHFSRYGLRDDSADEDDDDVDDPASEMGSDSDRMDGTEGFGIKRRDVFPGNSIPTGGAVELGSIGHATGGDTAHGMELETDGCAQNLSDPDNISEEASLFGDTDVVSLERTHVTDFNAQHLRSGNTAQGSALVHSLPAALELDVGELVDIYDAASGEARNGDFSKQAPRHQGTAPVSDRRLPHAWRTTAPPLKLAATQASSTTPPRIHNFLTEEQASGRGVLFSALPSPSPEVGPRGPAISAPTQVPERMGSVMPLIKNTHSPVDAAMLLGRSFRAGWGPGGMLAMPRVGRTDSEAHLSCVNVEVVHVFHHCAHTAAVGGPASVERTRQRIVSGLKAHDSLSRTALAGAPGDAQTVPLRDLRCSTSRDELERTCRMFYAVALEALEAAHGCELDAALSEHEMGSWELLLELFAQVDCSDAVLDEDADDPDSMSAESDTNELTVIRRRAKLSTVLRQLVFRDVRRSVMAADTLSAVSLAWLTGHQAAPALAAAASNGDIRIATMMAAVFSGCTDVAPAAQQQLDVWEEEGFVDFIPTDHARIYRLLAGRVAQAVEGQTLDWRRSLGLYLWYALPPTASLSDVVKAFWDDVATGRAVTPLPPYHQVGALVDPYRGEAAPWAPLPVTPHVLDTQFGLLCLSSGVPHPCGKDGLLGTLLCPSGHTPDPFDHFFGWALGGVLRAIGGLSGSQIMASGAEFSQQAPHDLFFRQCAAMVAHLEMLGEPMWAVYAACHLPYHPLAPSLRDHLVSELLSRHAPHLLANGEAAAEQRLCSELGVPVEWLASAAAQWAAYQWQKEEQAYQLVAAKEWEAAHDIVFHSIAPSIFLRGERENVEQLRELLSAMTPHLAGSETWKLGAGLYSRFYELEGCQATGTQSLSKDVKAFGSTLSASVQKYLRRVDAASIGHPDEAIVALSHMATACAQFQASTDVCDGTPSAPGLPLGLEASAPVHQNHFLLQSVCSLSKELTTA